MKKTTTSIAILLLLAGTFFSCNNEKEEYFDEPIDVPFTVFSKTSIAGNNSLPKIPCEWMRSSESLIIINSNSELRRHITCIGEYDLPIIDFSKYTLLLVRGEGPNIVRPNSVDLQQLSYQSYVMNVCMVRGGLAWATYWHVAIIIDKLNTNANVRLNKNYYPC